MMTDEGSHPLPGHAGPLRSTVEPRSPGPIDRLAESPERVPVPHHAEVVVVAAELPRERGALIGDCEMTEAAAPLADALDRSAEAALRRLQHHHPVSVR